MIRSGVANLAELIADAKAAEREMEQHRRAAALKTLTRLERVFVSHVGERVWAALEAADYIALGVPSGSREAEGVGEHVLLHRRGCHGRGCIRAVEHRDGTWWLSLTTVTETGTRNNVPASHLVNVVLLMVERLETAKNAAPRVAGTRVDLAG